MDLGCDEFFLGVKLVPKVLQLRGKHQQQGCEASIAVNGGIILALLSQIRSLPRAIIIFAMTNVRHLLLIPYCPSAFVRIKTLSSTDFS